MKASLEISQACLLPIVILSAFDFSSPAQPLRIKIPTGALGVDPHAE